MTGRYRRGGGARTRGMRGAAGRRARGSGRAEGPGAAEGTGTSPARWSGRPRTWRGPCLGERRRPRVEVAGLIRAPELGTEPAPFPSAGSPRRSGAVHVRPPRPPGSAPRPSSERAGPARFRVGRPPPFVFRALSRFSCGRLARTEGKRAGGWRLPVHLLPGGRPAGSGSILQEAEGQPTRPCRHRWGLSVCAGRGPAAPRLCATSQRPRQWPSEP